jgi:uncharacterized membrane protein
MPVREVFAKMNIVLWILQVLLAIYFFVTGLVHFTLPTSLPPQMSWMFDLPPALHWFSGTVEILAALGLVLPGVTKVQPRLTTWAALGLVLVMAGAAVWHLQRGELTNISMNALMAILSGFVAFGRWRLAPFTGGRRQQGSGRQEDSSADLGGPLA